MASPNETKLSEHQSGDTDHTAPSTPTPGELSAAGTAQEGVQGNSGESPAPVTHASDIETEFHEQSHGEPFLDYSHSPVTDVAASAADQPPQVLTEIAALLSAVDTTSASSKSASDDGKGSNPDDGESETGNDDGSHADDDDSNVSDSDKEDDMDDRLFDPINHTSEDNPDNDTDNGAGPGNMSEENRVGGYQSLQVPNPFEPDHGDGTSIADDPLNYGDFSDEEDDLAEAIRASVADQATPSQAYSAAEASSSHVNSENKASMTGAAAESDIEKVVAASPLGSASSSGANIDTPTTSSTDSEQSTGGTTASTTFPSIYPSHDDVEHSSPTILTPTSSQHSEDGNNEAMTSKSIGCSEQPGSSVEVAPIRSDHDDELLSDAASEPDPPPPSAKSKGKQREAIEDELPKTSTTPIEASPSNPTHQASVQDPTATEASNKPPATVHLRLQYRVQNTLRHKSTTCISVPTTLTLPILQQTIKTALLHHNGVPNPQPIDAEAEIARLLAVCWTKKGDDAGGHAVCDVTEVTVGNVAGVLGRLAIGCRYDVVKVEVGPGTNGGVRGGKKGGGKVYGKAGGKSGV